VGDRRGRTRTCRAICRNAVAPHTGACTRRSSGPTSDATTQELAERVAAATRVDPAIVELLRAHPDSLRLIDRRRGAFVIFDQLRRHVAHIQSLWKHGCAARTIQPLAASLAEACALPGWQALDLGKPHAAWSYYELAKHAAHEASDPNARAHATAEQAYVLIDTRQHAAAIELLGLSDSADTATTAATFGAAQHSRSSGARSMGPRVVGSEPARALESTPAHWKGRTRPPYEMMRRPDAAT
jgi:hypothetical protein